MKSTDKNVTMLTLKKCNTHKLHVGISMLWSVAVMLWSVSVTFDQPQLPLG